MGTDGQITEGKAAPWWEAWTDLDYCLHLRVRLGDDTYHRVFRPNNERDHQDLRAAEQCYFSQIPLIDGQDGLTAEQKRAAIIVNQVRGLEVLLPEIDHDPRLPV